MNRKIKGDISVVLRWKDKVNSFTNFSSVFRDIGVVVWEGVLALMVKASLCRLKFL